MIEIKAIRLNNGFFVSGKKQYSGSGLYSKYKYNEGMTLQKTHTESWEFVPRKIVSIKETIIGDKVNERFELKNPEMVSDHIPLIMPRDEVMCCDCKDNFFCGCAWSDDYSHLQSLYEEKYERLPEALGTVEFTWIEIGSADTDFVFNDFSFKTKGNYNNNFKPRDNKLRHIVDYENITDSALYPQVMSSELPCKLKVSTWYEIIRHHINTNINPKYAVVTSDYDFCLTVKRRCFKTFEESLSPIKSVKTDHVEIFNCTPSNYKGYRQLETISGKNYNDLMENVTKYLADLMERINAPTHICEKCSGYGYVTSEPKRL